MTPFEEAWWLDRQREADETRRRIARRDRLEKIATAVFLGVTWAAATAAAWWLW